MSIAEKEIKLRYETFENTIKQKGEVPSDNILTAFQILNEKLGSKYI